MSKNKPVDFIIVGQGLAGSLLAYFLLKRGQRIAVFDNNNAGSSSRVAAGIINPITGRRFVKSWMFDELKAFNDVFYPNLEAELGIKLYSKRRVLRFLQKNKDVNEWHARSAFEEYEFYMKKAPDWQQLDGKIHQPEAFGGIDHAAQVNMPLLLETVKNKLLTDILFFNESIDFKHIIMNDESVSLKEIKAQKIIFCEGQNGRNNPFFSYLPFEVSKGEILIAHIPKLKCDQIIKDKLIIAPLGNDLYWCGSNYEWNALDDQPTESIRKDLITKLKQTLKIDFEIVEHRAAIRPTVKDRRPFLGIHPDFPQLAIFNGLGTKGASLGPFWANHFVNYLCGNAPMNDEVNINRFS